jgi:proteasome lid subunit RPN8/RPN11
MTVFLPPDLMAAMRRLADTARPREACALLLGRGSRVAALAPSRNLAERDDAFEIDAALHLRLQRAARSGGPAVIGVWHSHPQSPARPSARDLAGAWDATLLWLITGSDGTRVFRIEAGEARELTLAAPSPRQGGGRMPE